MVVAHPLSGTATKAKKRKRRHSRNNGHESSEKGSQGNKRENDEETSHNASSDLLRDVRKIVEAQIRVKRKNAQSTVLEQLDAETLGIFDTTKFVEDSLLASTSEPPPDPGHWQSHPAIMKGTFSDFLGLKTTLSPCQLKGAISNVSHQTVVFDERKRAQALLETICISMVKLLLDDLHAVFGLPCDKLGGNFPKTLSSYFCVNELTWTELARQCIIMHLAREHFDLSSNILGLIRGTSCSEKSNRTMICLLRQRIECQYSEAQRLRGSGSKFHPSCENVAIPQALDSVLCKLLDRRNAETVEEDSEDDDEEEEDEMGGVGAPEFEEKHVLRKLLRFINQMEHVVRRRCAVVLWRLLEMGAGHHFWSEPDNPEYYDIISQPICLYTVFCKVMRPTSSGGYDDETLREKFLKDVRLIFENAWCFNDGEMDSSQTALDLSRTFERLVMEWLPLEENVVAPSVVISSGPVSTTTEPSLSSQDYYDARQQPNNPLSDSIQVDSFPTKDHDSSLPSSSIHSDLVDTEDKMTDPPLLSSSTILPCVSGSADCLSSPSSPHLPTIEQPDPPNSESVNHPEQLMSGTAALLASPFMYMCSECHCGAESDPAVFCYRCDARYHLKCLVPPLEVAPSDAWFCHPCQKGVIWGPVNTYGGQVRHNDLLGRPAGYPMELLCGSGQDGRLSRGECEGDVGMGGLTQWGIFSGIPQYLDWTLNAKVGRLLSIEGETRVLLDALRLLSSRDGGFLPSSSAWTPGERVVVMLSLCHVGLRSQSLKQYLSKAEIHCNSLRHSIVGTHNVKSSPFLKLLNDVGGEQAIMFWKRMLQSGMRDFNDTSEEECFERGENLSGSKDFCLVCWQHASSYKTLACSICQGEVHLSCAMTNALLLEGTPFCCGRCKHFKTKQRPMPTADEFNFLEDPAFLQDRLNREKVFREAAIDIVMTQSSKGPDKPISKRCGKCSACRARNCRKCSFCKDNPLYGGLGKLTGSCIRRQCKNGLIKVNWEETLSRGELCDYCGHAEQSLCSSMVVGQTKAEAELFIENVLAKAPPHVKIPSLPIPYLPLVDSKDTKGITGPHVHEVCARLMLKARIEKAQQTLRHLKRRTIKEAIWFSGFYIEPLGIDRANRVYYRFPGDTSWVYVCRSSEEDFNQNNNTTTLPVTDWLAYDASEVPRLLKWLNPQGICENKLVQALIEAFPEKSVEENGESSEPPPYRPEGSISSVNSDDILLSNPQNKSEENLQRDTEQQMDSSEQSEVDGHHGAAAEAAADSLKRCQKGNAKLRLCEKPGSVLPPTETVINCEIADSDVIMDDNTDIIEILEDQHYCVTIVDDCGKQIHLPQSSVVCFDVLFNGHPVAHKELAHPNGEDDDDYFYFGAVRFKRVGTFSLNFSLLPDPTTISSESATELLALRDPVVLFVVKVTKHYCKTGGAAALTRLRAVKFLRRSNQSCLYGLDFNHDEIDDVPFDVSEFEVLRLAVKVVAAALPDCALSEVSHDSFLGGFWNPSIREAWISHVREAELCQHLMEALLLLESCVAVRWLQPWYKQVVQLMPGIDSLLRLSTPSAVALRLCLLDKALLYDKKPPQLTFAPRVPRSTRSTIASTGNAGNTTTTTSLENKMAQQQQQIQKKPFVRNTRTSRAAYDKGDWEVFYASEEEGEFEDNDSSDASGGDSEALDNKGESARGSRKKEIDRIKRDFSENGDESIHESVSFESSSSSHNDGGGSEEEEYVDDARYDYAAGITLRRRNSKHPVKRLSVSHNNESSSVGNESESYIESSNDEEEISDSYSVSNVESEDDVNGSNGEDEFDNGNIENDGWPCPTCTFKNENDVTRCTVCNALQPRKASIQRKKKKRNFK